jgi:predicted RNA-binding Zn-ribbon protein involved in translation (DUF1610 family)
MTSDTSLRKKDLICPECGSIIKILDEATSLVCSACGTSYTYHPESRIVPYLNFQQEGQRSISYEVTNDLILTRNDRGFIILQDAKMPSIMERMPIRTHYVSKPHLEISVENRYELVDREGEKTLLRKLDCQIKDANSQNGTMVNDTRLKIDEKCQLKHNDVITLAPNCSGYVKIVFKQRHLS